MKKCNQFEKQLVAYMHGELGESESCALEQHLESCVACRAELEAQRVALSLLGDALAGAPAPETLKPWYAIHRKKTGSGHWFGKIWYSPQFKSTLAAGALASLFIVISGSVVVFNIFPKKHEPVVVAIKKEPVEIAREEIHVPVDKGSMPIPEAKWGKQVVAKSKQAGAEAPVQVPSDIVSMPRLAGGSAVADKSSTYGLALFDTDGFSASGVVQYKREGAFSRARAASDFNTEQYDWIPENAFKMAMDNPLSTFSIDVDRAAYANVRRFLNDNQLPPPDAVRIEEMINYFDYNYPEPEGEDPFAISLEVADCPWNDGHQLAMVGLQGVKVDTRDLPSNNLVFLLDVSGSMDSPDKLPLLKSAMRLLVDQLRPEDRVSIVVYAGAAGLVLEPTADKERIAEAIERLNAGGSTAGGAGIELAYRTAQEGFIKNGNNRVILATDGDFNIGVSSDGELVRIIEDKRKSGIYLTVLGFGRGNLKDSKMEKLADKGNGNYAYIDDILEAKKTLVNEMGGTLLTIAKDVKIQVEFNPAQIKAYRLIGYENRMLAKEDFDDDKKDAGELGAGHTVTALYELIPAGSGETVPVAEELMYQRTQLVDSDDLMTVKLRYKQPDSDVSKLLVRTVAAADVEGRRPSDNFRFASEVAEFGLLLRDSEFKGNASFGKVIERAKTARGEDAEGYRSEFIRLVEKARLLNAGASD